MTTTSHFLSRDLCPVCAGASGVVVYRTPYDTDPVRSLIESLYRNQGTVDWSLLAGAEYVAAHCPDCDLLYQQMVPDDALLEEVYCTMISPAALDGFERALITLTSVDKIAGELATLFRLTGKAPADITLLDYGFGHGRWARVARGMGARVFGTEIGDDKRALAVSLGIEPLDDAEIDGMQFDIVHTEQVFEHLVHPGREFARLARATRTLFKAAVPGRGNVTQLLAQHGLPATSAFSRISQGQPPHPHDDAFSAIQPLEHLNAYSARTMQWLGNANGLELISRTRLGSVSVDISSAGRLARSLGRLGQMAAKAILRPDRGYYLFRKPTA